MSGVDAAIKDKKIMVNGNNFPSLVSVLDLIECSKSYIFVLSFCVAMFSMAHKSFERSRGFVLPLKEVPILPIIEVIQVFGLVTANKRCIFILKTWFFSLKIISQALFF